MKLPIYAALAASAAIGLGAPAMAQPYGPPPPMMGPGRLGPPGVGGGWDIERRIGWLQERINRGAADGSLDRRELRRVQFELNQIRRDENRMRAMHRGRLWDRDRDILQARLDRVSDSVRWLRQNPDYRRPW